ncbi:LOW QUALITY PROTEIN: gap junction delta-4 protein-like [Boleophthalmus pectinirostris]|uniref:LOW QUALITY PROTEIN: gap junction delta-4 protein-like n=1 Tax=Boleophthalmus pectinirostris TaxID=150288 RepID=UPI00242DFD2C|nr:LOW QUALITY PROTEIN: gap junction delta-4 protein-like [Boleophthalmus pectinirostris]
MVGVKDLVLITVSHNVSFVGKSWLLFMIGFRSLFVFLAGFSLFGDEQQMFVCDTLQPGCSNLCFNLFSPLSVLRLWLLHLLLLLLPHLLFLTYVTHSVLSAPPPPPPPPPSSPRRLKFSCAYVSVVLLRTLLDAAFGVGQFLLYGSSFPKTFLCFEAPCASGIECFVSRATEKSLMLNVMLAAAALSVCLGVLDLLGSLKAAAGRRKKRENLPEEPSRGERSGVFSAGEDADRLLTKRASNDAKHANGRATKPPVRPRPDPAAAAAASSGQQSDSSDSQDHRRAWV